MAGDSCAAATRTGRALASASKTINRKRILGLPSANIVATHECGAYVGPRFDLFASGYPALLALRPAALPTSSSPCTQPRTPAVPHPIRTRLPLPALPVLATV